MKIFKIFSTMLLLLTNQVLCRINLKLTNLECKSLDENLGHYNRCILKAIKRDLTEISVYYRLLKTVHNASIHLKLFKRGEVNSKPMYQYVVDICKFFRNTRRNPLAEIFYNIFELTKFSNMNHTCPYNHDLIVERCRIDTALLNKLVIAQGEYMISTIWYASRKPASIINLSVQMY